MTQRAAVALEDAQMFIGRIESLAVALAKLAGEDTREEHVAHVIFEEAGRCKEQIAQAIQAIDGPAGGDSSTAD